MTLMDHFAIWQRTLGDLSGDFNPQREILRQAFLSFRDRIAQLVGEIGGLLPEFTVHDITHLDALWRVADETAGPNYPLNPAEAFVLGSTFLLHDAGHVLAAYEDGLAGIKRSIEWRDLIAQRFEDNEPTTGSPLERSALFQVLRHLHAKQARQLGKLSWKVPTTGEQFHLLESFQLRDYYGDLIGEIAESHHWPAHRVAATFEYRYVNAPGFLAPAGWVVDALKVAFLLRTADAAHIDGQRAPWFLFALRHPDGISQLHWKFQAQMGQPLRTSRGELRLSSGSPFDLHDRQAWWLAYDVACMIDREVRDAQTLMRDTRRTPFAAVSVEHVGSPEAFATNVRTAGWEPVNVAPKIGDVPKVIANLGGATLYGDRPILALRELIQNAADAVRALRTLGEIEPREGEIEIVLARDGDLTWLHVTDTGIGMSRYVLTEVLLDFGHSLWSSESLRTELPGLASKGFKAIGRFGIGFFSVFMLGRKVVVTTRRFSRSSNDDSDQWLLEFSDGLEGRPTLRRPASNEALRRPVTRVSVALDYRTLVRPDRAALDLHFDEIDFGPQVLFNIVALLEATEQGISDDFRRMIASLRPTYLGPEVFPIMILSKAIEQGKFDDTQRMIAGLLPIFSDTFRRVIAGLCPTLDLTVRVKIAGEDSVTLVTPDDWQTLKPERLLNRLYKGSLPKITDTLLDLRETSGALLGRIGHAGSFHHAIVTYGGLRCGTVPNLAGVVLGHNNLDLARSESRPLASPEAWQRWAEAWIDLAASHDVDVLTDLHPFCPDRDLAVYRIGSEQLNGAQLSDWLQRQSEVRVFEGRPDHKDFDDVSKDNFRRDFRQSADILFLPSIRGELAKSLAFPPINYARRLEEALQMAWGEFEESEEDDIRVGEVCGIDITRSVTCYVWPAAI